MFSLISWFTLCLLGGLLTLWAVWSREIIRWRMISVIGFIFWVFLSGGAVALSQGWASKCSLLLPGTYGIIGFLSVPDETIYLFLSTQYGPKTCYIPWDPGKADQLQKDGEGDGSEFTVSWGAPGQGGQGIPGTDNGGEISSRPPNTNHIDKPEEKGIL